MGFWTGIKRAVNSTLGTEEFEPLDKIILGTKGLKASENFYSKILSKELHGTADNPVVIENLLEMKWQGSFRLKIYAKGYSNTGYVRIKRNGNTVYTFSLDAVTDFKEYYTDISFSNGDIIGLVVTGVNSSYGDGEAYLKYVDIYADVTDSSAFVINYR